MGLEADDRRGPNSTPKLTLSRLPYCKPRHPPPMQTPPLLQSLSVPFRWEEAPGKPRSAAEDGGAAPPPRTSGNKAAPRCLDLPPRLLPPQGDAKITSTPSPTTVLDGPYVGRSLSLACTFSFRRGPALGRDDGPRPGKRGGGRRLRSELWGSFGGERKYERGNVDISHSLGEIFRREKNVKITRVRKKSSFFGLSAVTGSNLWSDIYASFKQRLRGS